jgi:hypothetical protein
MRAKNASGIDITVRNPEESGLDGVRLILGAMTATNSPGGDPGAGSGGTGHLGPNAPHARPPKARETKPKPGAKPKAPVNKAKTTATAKPKAPMKLKPAGKLKASGEPKKAAGAKR